eukprot:7236066-Alexandrium_andersonii.AAC.1
MTTEGKADESSGKFGVQVERRATLRVAVAAVSSVVLPVAVLEVAIATVASPSSRYHSRRCLGAECTCLGLVGESRGVGEG